MKPQAPNNVPARLVSRLVRPVEKFMQMEVSSGLTLMFATLIALALANSELRELYQHLIHMPMGFEIGPFQMIKSFEHWVNDGLMAIFFYVVGLEIKREMLEGELSSIRKAALPIFAAIGGMIAPALIYAFFNRGLPTAHGWGIPMATDIAFAVGVLVLLGKRIPFSLKIFLLALAIVDDLGAVIVIAVFYTEQLSIGSLAAAGAFLALIAFCRRAGVKAQIIYFTLSIFVWFAVLKSGVHATIAGVVLGFLTPLRAGLAAQDLAKVLKSINSDEIVQDESRHGHGHGVSSHIGRLRAIYQEAMSPLQRMEEMLAPWVSFLIMPVFAFTNAGLTFGDASFALLAKEPVFLGIALGLAVGKPLGITLFSYLAYKLKLADLPSGVTWLQVIGVGALGGIGFTMALFVTHLSLKDPAALETGKFAILATSLLSALIGMGILLVHRPAKTSR